MRILEIFQEARRSPAPAPRKCTPSAGCLAALGGPAHDQALATLRVLSLHQDGNGTN